MFAIDLAKITRQKLNVHAPLGILLLSRYKFTGTGTDVPLMEWLRKYTFPTEASYQVGRQAGRQAYTEH